MHSTWELCEQSCFLPNRGTDPLCFSHLSLTQRCNRRFNLDSLQPLDPSLLANFEGPASTNSAIDRLENYSFMEVSSMKVLLSDHHVENSLSWRSSEGPNDAAFSQPIHVIMHELRLRFDFHTSISTTEDKTLVRAASSDIMLTVSPQSIDQISRIRNNFMPIGQHIQPHPVTDHNVTATQIFLAHKWFISSTCNRVVVNLVGAVLVWPFGRWRSYRR